MTTIRLPGPSGRNSSRGSTQGRARQSNRTALLASWHEQTDGWVPEKAKARLTLAMETWSGKYYQQFSADDGVRVSSEVFVENDRFLGYLDGISADRVIHEVKSTSRSPMLAGQLWKVQQSIQVKLYAVLADATGIRIEFAWKDAPYDIYRSEILEVTDQQKRGWEQELNSLADYIYSLGPDIHNYACNPDGCCLVTKGITSMCSYEALCDMGLSPMTRVAYKDRENRR
jgi:hypothetical protein